MTRHDGQKELDQTFIKFNSKRKKWYFECITEFGVTYRHSFEKDISVLIKRYPNAQVISEKSFSALTETFKLARGA